MIFEVEITKFIETNFAKHSFLIIRLVLDKCIQSRCT